MKDIAGWLYIIWICGFQLVYTPYWACDFTKRFFLLHYIYSFLLNCCLILLSLLSMYCSTPCCTLATEYSGSARSCCRLLYPPKFTRYLKQPCIIEIFCCPWDKMAANKHTSYLCPHCLTCMLQYFVMELLKCMHGWYMVGEYERLLVLNYIWTAKLSWTCSLASL